MQQLTQKLGSGDMIIQEVPYPQLGKGMVIVKNHYSIISAGTEGSTVQAARKSLIGKGVIVEFTNNKGVVTKYDHDKAYEINKEKFEAMECFQKYKSYTATNNVPSFAKDAIVEYQKTIFYKFCL